MKLSTLAVTSIALLSTFSTASVNAAEVTLGDNLDFLMIDGETTNKSFFSQKARSFDINDSNPHQVVVRVTDVIRNGSQENLFESEPIIIKFTAGKEDIKLQTPRLSTQNDLKAFQKNPQILLVTSKGEQLANVQEYLVLEGFLPGTKIKEMVAEYNQSKGKAAMNFVEITTDVVDTTGAKLNAVEKQLQYWFKQADKETQTRFLQWIKEQR